MSTKVDYDEINDASSIQRLLASTVDIFIVFFIRVVTAQLLFSLWLSDRVKLLAKDYVDFFGSDVIDGPDKLNFIMSHDVFSDIIFFVILLSFHYKL